MIDIPDDEATGRAQVAKVRYTHDGMIDMMIAQPFVSQGELAERFGYTQAWVSTIIGSDAFQVRLAARRDELVDPAITLTLEERFRGLANRSLEILQEKLSQPSGKIPDALVLKAVELGAKGSGVPGFGYNGGGIPPAAPSDRLERLAERLTGLIGIRREGVIDVQANEIHESKGESSEVSGGE